MKREANDDSTPDTASERPSKSPRSEPDTQAESACPICQTSLSLLTLELAEFHVNGCLDVIQLESKKTRRRSKPQIVPQPTSRPPLKPTGIAVKHEPTCETTKLSAVFSSSNTTEDLFAQVEQTPLDPEATSTGAYKYVYPQPPANVPGQKPAGPSRSLPKPLPDYKTMPGTTFTVDAFKYGSLDFCTAYFLTHFHSDHYGGLTKTGFLGHIYCSRITANCVTRKIGVSAKQVHPLPMNTRCIVQDVYVTLLDAEHCPGAAIILFEVPIDGGKVVRIVHTGDFRASRRHIDQIACVFTTPLVSPVLPEMLSDKARCRDAADNGKPQIDYVYLDTTYLDPTYSFPCQRQVIAAVGEACHKIQSCPEFLPSLITQARDSQRRHSQKHSVVDTPTPQPARKSVQITQWFKPLQQLFSAPPASKNKRRTLFVVGTYTIGKEKLFVEIARRLQAKIYMTPEKRKLLDCLESPGLTELLTDDMYEAQVHAVSMNVVNMRGMTEYLQAVRQKSTFTSIVAFSPTGWSHAGSYFPAVQAPLVQPQGIAAAELDAIYASGDIAGLVDALAVSARLNDDSGGRSFGINRLKPRGSPNSVTIFPVPYSEHSSFAELARFVCSLNCKQVVPTVFSTPDKNRQAGGWLQHWSDLKQRFEERAGKGFPAFGVINLIS
ncbi:repair protein PSO2 SNM1 [Coemansia sp. S142-1]|nr:repair protein PSO2 SNM1 [Coemansia sp. S142-1]